MARPANAFDFIRILAALAVLYSHSFVLYGLPEPQVMAGQTFGSLAVAVFFALSGFLICQSWQRDPSVIRFAMRRVLRIFPGLLVVVLLTALVVGPLMTQVSVHEYFGDATPWRYIRSAGLALGSPPIIGLFEHSLYPNAVNGSLWTLKYEILMYMVLAVSGRLFARSSLKLACALVFAAFALAWCALAYAAKGPIQLPGLWRLGIELYADRIAYLGAFFFGGALANVYLPNIKLSWLAAAALLVPAFFVNNTAAMVLLWLAIPYCVLVFAFKAPAVFRKVNGFDYSYGIYIYAFPIQQVISEVGQQHGWPWSAVLSAPIVATVALAGLSWHCIEQPALSFKDRIWSFGRQPQPTEASASPAPR